MRKITRLNFFFSVLVLLCSGVGVVSAQCPTVTNPNQSFCDIQASTIADLVATDNGNGVVWYPSTVGTTPLLSTTLLMNNTWYYADDNSGACGSRQGVYVTVLTAPTGPDFQTSCVEDAADATIGNSLALTGYYVQWYENETGGTPLPLTTQITGGTIYYASQMNPFTGCETSRKAVFVDVVLIAPPTGDPIQYFCNDPSNPSPTLADVDVDTVASSVVWYPSSTSFTPLPITTPLVNGVTYYVASYNAPCISSTRLAVTVILSDLNQAGDSNSLSICDYDLPVTGFLDLFDNLGGTPSTTGVWTGSIATANGHLGTVDLSLLTYDVLYTFTYSVTDSAVCPEATATVDVIIISSKNPGQDGVTPPICPTSTDLIDLFSYLGGTPDVGGTWSPALASGTGIFNPTLDSFGVYTYSFNDGCSDTSTVTITQQPVFDAGDDGVTPAICPDDTTLYNLFDYLNGTPDVGGIWTPALASGTGIFDPTQDAFGVYTYSFTDGCSTDTATVTVVMLDVLDPGMSNPAVSICAGDMTLIDLFAQLGGTPDIGGTWSPALASGTNIFNPALDSFGVYTYSFNDGCSDTSTVTVIEQPVFDAGDDGVTPAICPDDTTLYNLFDELGGTPDVGGIWTPALASGTGMFDPTQDAFGVYTYSFTDGCSTDTATVTVVMLDVLDPGISNPGVSVCSGDMDLIDLFAQLGGTPDVGGTWSPALASGTNIFNPALDSFGVYTYSFNDGCSDTSTVTVVEQPVFDAGDDGVTPAICPDDTTLYNLFDYLNGTPDVGGIWTPALASGTGMFDPTQDAFGVYTYSFTDGCSTDTATVTVVMDIPGPSISNPDVLVCAGDMSLIDLFDELEGAPNPGGVWTPALASGTGVFDPAVDTFGTYVYSFGDGCVSISEITIIQLPVFDPGTSNSISVCEDDTTLYNLFDYLNGTPDVGGIWTPALASGTGMFDPTQDAFGVYTYSFTDSCSIDTATVTVVMDIPGPSISSPDVLVCAGDMSLIDLFDELEGAPNPGGVWTPALASGTGVFDPAVDTFGTYVYSSGDGCVSISEITIIQLPVFDPGTSNSISVCADDLALIDLFDELGGTPDVGGIWTPALASGTGMFDPSQDSFGVYTYSFNDGCSDTATVTITQQPVFDAGDDNSTPPICFTDTTLYNLFDYLGGTPNAGGVWTPALASGTGMFDPTQDAFGVYTYSFTDGCSTDTATVTVVMLDVLDPGISNPAVSICAGDMTLIDLFAQLGGTPDVGGTWSPALASGTNIFNPALDSFGVYTYSFNDGCSDTSTVTVVEQPVFDAGDDGTTPPICPTDTTLYNLFDELGGTPDVGGIWTPALANGTGMFDPTQDAFGVYTYSFTDGCSTDTATVTVVMLNVLDPGISNPGVSICSGDMDLIDLFAELGGSPDVGGTWSPALASGTGIFDPSQDAFGVYTYSFNDGCSDTSTVTVIEQPVFDAGDDNTTPPICPDDTTLYNLFDYLGGTPDAGGIWTPTLASGTGMFDPSQDAFGVYTYSFNDCSSVAVVTVVEDENCDELFIPDGFSPNEDGINDYFEIKNIRTLYPNFKIQIYNRYGNILFKGDASKPDWDGRATDGNIRFDGGVVPVGVYFFILEFNDGQRKPLQGRLYLSR